MSDNGELRVTSRTVDIQDALNFEPFYGDESDTSVLSDKIVRAAKDHPRCQICDAPIKKGEVHRATTERSNEGDGIATYRFCNKCCRAMAMNFNGDDEGRLVGSRDVLGERRRAAARMVSP